ncbi:ATP-binding protein [Sphingomonas sp. LY160]|uniref:ATP-binding protein n=1 Tax=Sphingomonas sp. LY160 TaxID=3095342 RepID=UPI002ADEF1FA|nr:ATP-binding protein [Sphingomonas sp. LY160]MEA1072019.1 ATP-binding protein [Sphingomonas sp. LY160]
MVTLNPLAQSILDAIADPALILSSGTVAAANRAARSILGEQVVGRDVRIAIRHPLALETIASGRTADVEVIGIGSAERPWVLAVRPLNGGAVLVRLSDRSAALAAERMRTDFVANASHELRTPLATIIGYAETLAEEGPLPDEMRSRFGHTIEGEARRMLRIVEDLMSLSRIEADRFRLPEETVDLVEVARLSVDHAAAHAEQRNCTVELVPSIESASVQGDFGQLMQLADNLIGNALRYGCGEDSCTVRVEVRAEAGKVELVVQDDGDGIAAEHLPRLTERFYRVDSARSRESGGTGLGLAIVKHIVERHRGRMTIRSSLGSGTTVTVTIPSA